MTYCILKTWPGTRNANYLNIFYASHVPFLVAVLHASLVAVRMKIKQSPEVRSVTVLRVCTLKIQFLISPSNHIFLLLLGKKRGVGRKTKSLNGEQTPKHYFFFFCICAKLRLDQRDNSHFREPTTCLYFQSEATTHCCRRFFGASLSSPLIGSWRRWTMW